MIGEWTNKLAELVKEFFGFFKFWEIINHYSEAVVLRFGKFNRVLKPGFHFILPAKVEIALDDNIKPQMLHFGFQSITLKDGSQISLQMSVMWSIIDIKTYILEIEDADSALSACTGLAQEYLFEFSWNELIEMRANASENKRRNNLPQNLRTEFNYHVTEFGAKIEEVFINSFIKTSLKDGLVRVL